MGNEENDEQQQAEMIQLALRLGSLIREERDRKGLTQGQVASEVGVTQKRWSIWESAPVTDAAAGKHVISALNLPNLPLIERALGVRPTTLLQRLFAEWMVEHDFESCVLAQNIADEFKLALIQVYRGATAK